MQSRKLFIFAAIVSLFGFGVIIWYFFFSTPSQAPTLGGTSSALPLRDLPARFSFIFQDEGGEEQTTETEVTQPGMMPFINVWDKPSAGNAFVSRQILKEITATTTSTTSPQVTKTVRATTTVLMFVDRATGYVYGHAIESGRTYQISNTTLPGIYDAYIFAGGDRILMRYLDNDKKTIVSVLAGIPNVQEGRDPQALSSFTYLPNGIRSVAVSDSRNSVSYLVPNDAGSSIYTITAKGTVRVADSSFSEWKLSYGGENLYATTLPSAYVEGMTVSLPSFSRLVGGKTGLMSTPSPKGGLLNSMWSRSGLLLFGSDGGKTSVLDITTLADKCQAIADAAFVCGVPDVLPASTEGLPDDWYQGRVSFEDSLMLVYPLRGEAYQLYSFDKKHGPMDVTHLETNPAASLMSFIRKKDGTLWLLNTNLLADE
jgi:hypothetical protein